MKNELWSDQPLSITGHKKAHTCCVETIFEFYGVACNTLNSKIDNTHSMIQSYKEFRCYFFNKTQLCILHISKHRSRTIIIL